jgi:GNAT superfamily N-acetyltransferase
VDIACENASVTTPTPDAGVRPARPADADAIGRVHVAAWRAAYAELLPAAVETLDAAALADSWRAAVTDPPSADHRVLVATAGPDVVGFAALGPATDADAEPGEDAELLVLLVDPAHGRAGHGSRLLNATADTVREGRFRRLRAWVPEADGDRQRFLGAAGFAADGAARVLDAAGDGTTLVREVRWTTSLET